MGSRWLGLALALAAACVSAWAYTRLPAAVTLPWLSPAANPVSPVQAALMVPSVITGVWLLLQLFPLIDPWGGEPYSRFSGTYWLLANSVLLFLLAAHTLMLAAATGVTGGTGGWIIALAGVLAAVVGNYLGRIEPNWFFGLRTPWTLSDAAVWRRTHRFMGKVLFVAGLVLVGLAPFVALPTAGILGATGAAVALGAFVSSWVFWRRLRGGSHHGGEEPS